VKLLHRSQSGRSQGAALRQKMETIVTDVAALRCCCLRYRRGRCNDGRQSLAARYASATTPAAWRYSPRSALAPIRLRLQQLWQPGKVRGDSSHLIFRKQLRRRSPPRLILEIDIRERLSVVVADGETRGLFLDGPRSRKTTWRHLCRDQNAELKRSLGRSPPEASGCPPLARSSAAQRGRQHALTVFRLNPRSRIVSVFQQGGRLVHGRD
jgi:hypothetical protein